VTRTCLFAAGLLALVGCARTGTVSGTVTVGGAPLKHGGGVAFHPVGAGPTAVGQIDANGRYTLAVGTDAGVPPGEYKVTVVGYAEMPPHDPRKGAPPAPRLVTAPKFNDVTTTPLTRTVTAGANSIDLDAEPNPAK
jgi:hypothetical protein